MRIVMSFNGVVSQLTSQLSQWNYINLNLFTFGGQMSSVEVSFEKPLAIGQFHLTWVKSFLVLFTYSNFEVFPPCSWLHHIPTGFGMEALTSPFTLDYHTGYLISAATQKFYPVVNAIAPVLINVWNSWSCLSYNWACTCSIKLDP